MADLKISELPALAGALLAATDPIPLADLSASETKKVTVKDLVQSGIQLIDAGSIPGDKLASVVGPGQIGTVELANQSVTAPKLADQSTAVLQVGLPATGAYIGQLAVDTTDNTAQIWNGAAWVAFKAGGSLSTIGYDNTIGPLSISGVDSPGSVTLSVAPKATTAAAQFLAGPAGGAGTVDYRSITSSDIPAATATAKGAVTVNGFGLRLDGDRVEIANAVIARDVYGLVTYDANGLVTDGRSITSTDLPLATVSGRGAIALGTQFGLDGGNLVHANSIIAGTAAKVEFNEQGHITNAIPLEAADIPDLPASKISSGVLDASRIADSSITSLKLADYATSYIQDTAPTGTDHFHGQLWLNPLAQQIRMWDGNVWVPIGVGALSEQNLRFCGLFDATNGHITVVTSFGSEGGFNVGDVIPVASEQLTGSYFVSETAGNGTGVTPGVTYDPGDWCLCLGVAQGWQRIDTLSGGGGGGSLDSLADVTITTPGAGQVLTYSGTNWVNQTLVSASETVKGIIQLATDAEVKTGTNTVKTITPKTLADNYLAKDISALPALP